MDNAFRELSLPTLTAAQVQELLVPFSASDVETAIFDMKGSKSPGPDGAEFFHTHWAVIGSSVTEAVLSSPQATLSRNGIVLY